MKKVGHRRRIIFIILIIFEMVMLTNFIFGAVKNSKKVEQTKKSISEVVKHFNGYKINGEDDVDIEEHEGSKTVYIHSESVIVSSDIVSAEYPAVVQGNSLKIGTDFPKYKSLVWNDVAWMILIILLTPLVTVVYIKFKNKKRKN